MREGWWVAPEELCPLVSGLRLNLNLDWRHRWRWLLLEPLHGSHCLADGLQNLSLHHQELLYRWWWWRWWQLEWLLDERWLRWWHFLLLRNMLLGWLWLRLMLLLLSLLMRITG